MHEVIYDYLALISISVELYTFVETDIWLKWYMWKCFIANFCDIFGLLIHFHVQQQFKQLNNYNIDLLDHHAPI